MTNRKGWKGYNFSRDFGGNFVPQRVQNMVIRHYAEKQRLNFLFSVVEYYMEDCHMMLKAILEEIDTLSGLIFYSTHLLPKDNRLRKTLYNQLLKNNYSLHFALEELAIEDEDSCSLIEDILLCRALTQGKNYHDNLEKIFKISIDDTFQKH